MGIGMTCHTSKTKVRQGVASVAVKRPATLPHHPPPKGGGGGGADVSGPGRETEVWQNPAIGSAPTLASLAKQIADCEVKSTFRTRGDALRFLDRSGYPLAPYRCFVCGAWHLTSQNQGKGER